MEDKNTYRIILFFGVLAVTSSSFIIRYADQSSYALAFVRVLFTGLFAYFLLGRGYQNPTIPEKRDIIKIFIAGISLATHFGWWFDSLNYISIGASLSLTNTAPVWMAIFAYFVLKIKLKRRQIISILLVITGSWLLFIDAPIISGGGDIGLILALGSAIGFAIYLMLARDMVPKYGLWQYFGMVNIASAIFFVPWLLFNGEYADTAQIDLWLWGFLLASVPGVMGHAVYNFSMSKLDPIDVGVGTLGEPVLGTILAFFIFDESLSTLQFFAILNLLFAILFSIEFRSSKAHKSNSIQA